MTEPDQRSVAEMRRHWSEFGRRDPMFYIATNQRSWTEAEFFAHGRELVESVLDWAGGGIRRERMIEIGCGLGRMLVHFAPHFEHVEGVDIAPQMIARARGFDLPSNIHLATISGQDLAPYPDDNFDFAFCFQVFQHIPNPAVIESYLEEIRRTLRPAARAVVHFDSRPRRLLETIAMLAPDRLLPRTRRRYIRRYRLDRARPAVMAAAAALRVAAERGAGTDEHFLVLEKSSPG